MRDFCLRLGVFAALFCPLATLAHGDGKWFTVAGMTFHVPDEWEMELPESGMRKAVLKTPAEEGREVAEVVFFHFGTDQGGSTQDNLNRWFAQFEGGMEARNAKIAKLDRAGVPITFASAEGVFLSGMPGTQPVSKPDFALLGAILETPGGSIFIKMTGPKTVVEKHTQTLYAIVMQFETTAH